MTTQSAPWWDWLVTLDAAIILVVLILWQSGLPKELVAMLRRARSANLMGVQIDLTPENSASVAEAFALALDSATAQIDDKTQQAARAYGGLRRFKRLFIERVKSVDPAIRIRGRLTLHIADPLYSDNLYQILDYWSFDNECVLAGSGRRKSVRYGLIGRVFRLRVSLEQTKVEHTVKKLITEWGALHSEAEKYKGSKRNAAAFAIFAKEYSDPVAIIYLDTENEKSIFYSGGEIVEIDMTEAVVDSFNDSGEGGDLRGFVLGLVHAIKPVSLRVSISD